MKINDGHYLELMDRIHVQTCMIDSHLSSHPLTKKLKKVRKLIDSAQWALLEAYQVVGQKDYEREQKNNPIAEVILRRHKKSEK